MAPEEWVRGADDRRADDGVTLGRTLHHLLDSPAGWRGRRAQAAVTPAPPTRRPAGATPASTSWPGIGARPDQAVRASYVSRAAAISGK